MLRALSTEHPLRRLMLVYVFWIASWALAGSLFEVYSYSLGLSIPEIFLTGFLWFVGAPLLLPLFRGFSSRRFILIGIALAFFSVATLVVTAPSHVSPYLFRLLIGLPNLFFWIPFNTMYYEFGKENNALLGALYYSVMPLLSLALPVLSGWLAGSMGYAALYGVAMAAYAVTFVLAYRLLTNHEYRYDIRESLRSIAGLRSLVFLEGFAGAVIVSVTLETTLLLYVNQPFEFGGFVSLVTVFSVAASLITARLSDHYKTRRLFLIVSVAGFALASILASQAREVTVFFLGFGLVNFFRTIFFPLPLALTVDNSKSLVDTMVGREFMLGFGRISGVAVGYLILVAAGIQTTLLFLGVALLLYIPLFEMKKRKLDRR